jgi:O-antigen ligase
MSRFLQLGAIAVVLAVSTLFAFELDRFFVPKELVLHGVAVIAGLAAMRRIRVTKQDWLLVAYLGLSVASGALATNPWVALRAVAISASGVLLFWAVRSLEDAAKERVVNGVAIAVVLIAVTALLQTYGVESLLFSDKRAPGGTLGNRNFVAHAAAFGLPVLLLSALRAHRKSTHMLGAIGAAVVTASLVLTRSRAAWLAFAAVVLVFLVGLAVRGNAPAWRRFAGIVLVTGVGIAAVLLIPNALRWRSDNPYLETLGHVANYQEGSGRGRLIQYEQSLRMAAQHPLLGVGPGNWAVVYPQHAARNDPSMSDTDGGMTTNPWPSSDWIAIVSERGIAAAIVLALFLLGLVTSSFRMSDGVVATALLATLAGAGIAGAFDAVLLLALPTLLVWTTLGALSPRNVGQTLLAVGTDESVVTDKSVCPTPAEVVPRRKLVVLAVIALSALGAIRSAAQLTAMQIYATSSDRASLERSARIDPGNFRLRLRLARMGKRAQRCEHARAALRLFPNADSARAASRGCGE